MWSLLMLGQRTLFFNIYKIILWIQNLNEFLAPPSLSHARTNRKHDFLTMHRDNEIQQSSATNTTQNLLISCPLTSLLLSSWVGARRTLIWHQPPSVTNCCMMNYKADAGAVKLFFVTNIPWSQLGVVIDEWEETADRRCVFGATSNLSVWIVIRLRGLVLISREREYVCATCRHFEHAALIAQ